MKVLSFFDRYVVKKEEGVDVLMATLDGETFLEQSLVSLYGEVPVKRLLVCDGGSTDQTIPILKRFPRVELYVRPDIRTTGKGIEFLLSKAETEWIMFTDADLTFPEGWYDEMCKYRGEFDAFDSKRIHAYEFFREDYTTTDITLRPLVTSPQMGRRKALEGFKVDDDYLWRIVDIATRQAVEKHGYKYGKVATTFHFHHSTEETKYRSDSSKVARRLVFEEPKEIVVDWENWRKMLESTAKSYVKYIDPNLPYVMNDSGIDKVLLPLLDREWIEENGPAWLPRHERALRDLQLRNRLSSRVRRWAAGQVLRVLRILRRSV